MTMSVAGHRSHRPMLYSVMLLLLQASSSLPRPSLSFCLQCRPLFLLKSTSFSKSKTASRIRSSTTTTAPASIPLVVLSLRRCPPSTLHRYSKQSSSSSSSNSPCSSLNITHSLSTPEEDIPHNNNNISFINSNNNNLFTSNIVGGGDYAGLFATFSSKSGELIPVPQHLIPPSMLEWGNIPSCLETLTSENWNVVVCNSEGGDDDDENTVKEREEEVEYHQEQQKLVRTMITVLPEVGCGIDNLEVTKTSETIWKNHSDRLECWQYYSNGHPTEREVVAADRYRSRTKNNQQHNILDVETIFQIDSGVTEQDEETNINIVGEDDVLVPKLPRPRRIRISFSLDFTKSTQVLSNVVTLHVERLYSSQSTQGTRWSGPSYNTGGLDARTVMKTIGKDIMYGDVFGVKRMEKEVENGSIRQDPWLFPTRENEDGKVSILEGLWTKTSRCPNAGIEDVQYRAKQDFEPMETSTMVTLRLPQNICLRYGSDSSSSEHNMSWKIEVSHIDTITRDGKVMLQRRVVLRSFDKPMGQEGRIEDVSHWVEHKILN